MCQGSGVGGSATIQDLAAIAGVISTRETVVAGREAKKETKKAGVRRQRETAKLESEEQAEVEREEQIKVRDIQREKKKAQSRKGQGRAGTILTGRGAPGTTTGTSTTPGQKTLLGL